MRYKYQILLALFIVALMASILLATAPDGESCNIDGSCNVVQLSKQATTFGIKNCHYGIAIFLFMSILTFIQIKKPDKIKRFVINLGVVLGSLISLYFLYLQFFELKALCVYCLTVDISMLLSLAIVLSSWKK